jgi:mono/diheme cytochrome c family protein
LRLARVAVVGAAAAAVVAVAAGCGTVGRVEEASSSGGKELFQQRCGSCHTLADAGTQGTIGPDLDEAFAYARKNENDQGFDESTIRDVIRGQIAYPVEDPPAGGAGMPADLVTGSDADAVATYVASVAGVGGGGGSGPASGAGGGGTGGSDDAAADGEAIFTSAGCSGCHTLAAAGSSGTIGPNLDEAKPTLDEAVSTVRNGRGAMPAFRDQLSEEQIDAVAEYVASNAGE